MIQRILGTLVLASVALPAWAGPEAASKAWSSYGAPITVKKATKLEAATTRQIGKEVLVQGTISDVCQSKGCWLTVKDGKREVRVEFKDYGFFVPWSTTGMPVRLQGVVTERTMSPEDQEHIASESQAGGGVGTPSQEPKKLLVFVASGAAIQGGGEVGDLQKSKISGKPAGDGHDHSDPNHKH